MKTKKRLIKEALIAYPNNTDRQIADRVNCHPSYVSLVRKSLGLVYDEAAEIMGAKAEAATGVDAILDERGARYGKFIDHAEVTQNLKNVMMTHLQKQKRTLIVDQQEALEMIFHKVGRILNGDPNYADSWIDIAGYAKLVADRLEGKER